jgi:hypothetical protein
MLYRGPTGSQNSYYTVCLGQRQLLSHISHENRQWNTRAVDHPEPTKEQVVVQEVGQSGVDIEQPSWRQPAPGRFHWMSPRDHIGPCGQRVISCEPEIESMYCISQLNVIYCNVQW